MPLQTEFWENYILRDVTNARDNSFLKEFKDRSSWLKNGVVHIPVSGGLPDIILNNTTYPLIADDRKDSIISKMADKLETKPKSISIDEEKYLSYDKVSSVTEDHTEALYLSSLKRTVFNVSPTKDSSTSPIINIGNDKIKEKIIKLGTELTKIGVPLSGRVMFLSPEHHGLLLNLDNAYQGQYNNIKEGSLGISLWGFTLFNVLDTPYYDSNGIKKSYGSIPTTGDKTGSIAFWKGNVYKAFSKIDLYKTEPTATNKVREISAVQYFGAGLIEDEKYCGVLLD